MKKNPRLCTTPGCHELRWRGPSGNNEKLVMCEPHQRADWRKRKKPENKGEKQKPGPKPGNKKPASTQPSSLVKRMVIDHQTDTIIITQVINLSDLKSAESETKLERFIGLWKKAGFEIEDRRTELVTLL